MTPVISVILSLIMPTEPTFYPIAVFPDEMSCGAALAHMTHDAQCALTLEVEIIRPKPNPFYGDE